MTTPNSRYIDSAFENGSAPKSSPDTLMRYEVLVFDASSGEPLIGTIVTNMKLTDFCDANGLTMGALHSKGRARDGEETSLV